MRSRLLQLLIVPVLAGAMLLTGTNSAQAASATKGDSRSAVEAEAIQTAETVERSLRATGSAVFTDANGMVHRMSVSGTGLSIDGKAAVPTGPAIAAGWWCNIKVAAAISAITVLGAGFITLFIIGLPATATVSLAGFAFTVATWSRIATIMASGGSLVGILQTLIC